MIDLSQTMGLPRFHLCSLCGSMSYPSLYLACCCVQKQRVLCAPERRKTISMAFRIPTLSQEWISNCTLRLHTLFRNSRHDMRYTTTPSIPTGNLGGFRAYALMEDDEVCEVCQNRSMVEIGGVRSPRTPQKGHASRTIHFPTEPVSTCATSFH